MKPPIHEIIRRLRPFSPQRQLEHIAALIKIEGPRTSRRTELESLARDIRLKQTRKEIRQDRRAS